MTNLLQILKDRYVSGSRKVPSSTKKGPGRKHSQGVEQYVFPQPDNNPLWLWLHTPKNQRSYHEGQHNA